MFLTRSQLLRTFKPIPPFRPVPFKREKFLSMKSRTVGTYFTARRRIIKRSAAVLEEQQQQEESKQTECSPNGGLTSSKSKDIRNSNSMNDNDISHNGISSSSSSSSSLYQQGVLAGTPITAHMADEIDVWNRYLKNLEALQGFVLTDELVYDAISKNIHIGAFPYFLDWLRKAAQEARVPVPLFVIYDLRAFVDFVQSMLPASNASFSIAPEAFLGATAVGTPLSEEENASEEILLRLVNPSPYVRYLLKEMYIPVWECLHQLGLLPTIVEEIESESDWNRLMQEQGCKHKIADMVQHICSAASVHNSRHLHKEASHNGADVAIPSVLQAFLDLFLALTQCAAEAKELHFLLQLQVFFCALFVEGGDNNDINESRCRLREEVWCHNDADIERLRRFANDFLSAVYYGRHAYSSELALGRYMSVADTNKCAQHESDEVSTGEKIGRNRTWEDHEGEDEGIEGPISHLSFVQPHEGGYEKRGEQAKEEEEAECTNDTSADSSSPTMTLQDAVDNVMRNLLQNESLALPDASLYVALALQDASLIPTSAYSAAATSPSRFTDVEVEWIRIHCDLCHRSHLGENVLDALESLLCPNGLVARNVESSGNDNDLVGQECLLALVVDLIIAVATKPSTQKKGQQAMILRLVDEFLSRLKELQLKQERPSSVLLPVYSAASLVLLLAPFLTRNDPLNTNEANTIPKEYVCPSTYETALRVLRGLMVSLMEQPTGFGNAYSAVFMVLASTELWDEVLQLLHKLDTAVDETKSESQGISSVLVDQRVWAWMFRRARDAGRVDICLFLRRTREQLFY